MVGSDEEVLFDLEADPDESMNLIDRDDLRTVVGDLRTAVDGQLAARSPGQPWLS